MLSDLLYIWKYPNETLHIILVVTMWWHSLTEHHRKRNMFCGRHHSFEHLFEVPEEHTVDIFEYISLHSEESSWV